MPAGDEKNLELLSIFHYILGALTAIFASIPLIHLGIGVMMLTGSFNGGDEIPRIIGIIFVTLGGVIVLGGWTLAVLIIIAGSRLKQRRSYNFCLVMAFIECLIVPVGTALGVFSIITLTKEPVKKLFD